MGKSDDNEKPSPKNFGDIFIRNAGKGLKQELTNIAANNGQTLSGFLKPHLREIRDKYPESERRADN